MARRPQASDVAVTLSRRFTGGKLVLKRFRRMEDAEAWIAEQVKAKEHHGFTAFMLSPDQLADARAAFQRLEGLGKHPAKALGFVVLLERIMTSSSTLWLQLVCLTILVGINGTSAACQLALDRR